MDGTILTLSLKECARMVGVNRHTWSEWVLAGIAPQPINPGPGHPKLWNRREVLRWLREHPEESGAAPAERGNGGSA